MFHLQELGHQAFVVTSPRQIMSAAEHMSQLPYSHVFLQTLKSPFESTGWSQIVFLVVSTIGHAQVCDPFYKPKDSWYERQD